MQELNEPHTLTLVQKIQQQIFKEIFISSRGGQVVGQNINWVVSYWLFWASVSEMTITCFGHWVEVNFWFHLVSRETFTHPCSNISAGRGIYQRGEAVLHQTHPSTGTLNGFFIRLQCFQVSSKTQHRSWGAFMFMYVSLRSPCALCCVEGAGKLLFYWKTTNPTVPTLTEHHWRKKILILDNYVNHHIALYYLCCWPYQSVVLNVFFFLWRSWPCTIVGPY